MIFKNYIEFAEKYAFFNQKGISNKSWGKIFERINFAL
jgi:hypothetical protein